MKYIIDCSYRRDEGDKTHILGHCVYDTREGAVAGLVAHFKSEGWTDAEIDEYNNWGSNIREGKYFDEEVTYIIIGFEINMKNE